MSRLCGKEEKQEKGWLLYLRCSPWGMTNNSAGPLFPKLSRYKQIVIVKLLNFGRFAAFTRRQKGNTGERTVFLTENSGHRNCHGGGSSTELVMLVSCRTKCSEHVIFFSILPCSMLSSSTFSCTACYLIIQSCKKLYKGVTARKKLYKSVNACKKQ